jgi:hypothetical protein
MQQVVEELTGGEPLSIDQRLEYLPVVKEVAVRNLIIGRGAGRCYIAVEAAFSGAIAGYE